jgi:hypothetical protein
MGSNSVAEVNMALAAIVDDIQKRSKRVKTSQEIAQVGTISAMGYRDIGDFIAKATEKDLSDFIAQAMEKVDEQIHRELFATKIARALPPPRNAKFTLLLFLSKEDREVQLGDLEETYYKIAEEFGSRRANFWYRSQVVRSLGPWMWTLIKRGGIASGGLFSLGKVTEFFGRLLGG